MEASALHAPAGVSRLRNPAGASFLRLRSDDQLVDLFRAGHEEAFRVIHDRYRARLFAYMRQMLSGSRQDAEDALQDVFIRAYSGLRANDRHLALRAWLYRVAHNRCVDQLRKNMPILTEEIEATSQDVSTDPIAAMQQREELRKLITDVQRLPEQQRSALLLREMSGMSYQELADSLELSIPAIKSLLVRARGGLAAAAEARDTDCSQIRGEIVDSHERGARPNALTRRHLSDCTACREYRESVRSVSKSLAALIPAGPLILAAKLLGVGTAYSAAAYSSGGAAAGGAAAGAAAGAGAAAVGGAATGGAAAGGAAAAAGGAAATGAVAGGVAASGAAVAGGVSAAHIAAIIAAAAAAGGAVAVTDQSSTHHASAPLHPASSVIRQAVKSGVTHGYAPAAVAPVAPITAVTPATAPANAAASTIANAVVTKLKHQATTPATATTSAATTSTTATTSSAGVTATTGSGGSSLAATASPTTGPATATGGASAAATTSAPTSTAPASSSTVATTSSAPATTAGTSSAASTTPVHTDSTAASSATTAGSSTSPNATASPTNSAASTPPPTS